MRNEKLGMMVAAHQIVWRRSIISLTSSIFLGIIIMQVETRCILVQAN